MFNMSTFYVRRQHTGFVVPDFPYKLVYMYTKMAVICKNVAVLCKVDVRHSILLLWCS